MVFVAIAILAMCFILLFLLSNYLIDGLVKFSKNLKLSLFFLSSLILAIGTSVPELISGVVSTLVGAGELGVGAIVGSCITNICLILSVTALLSPVKRIKKIELRDNLAVIASSLIFYILIFDSVLSRIDGVILIASYAAYLYILHRKEFVYEDDFNPKPYENIYVIIPASIFGILVIGWVMINVSVHIATITGLSLGFFGLTIIALSTSLPELTTSMTATFIHKSKIAVANVVGSNIVNLLLIGGIVALVNPVIINSNQILVFSIIFMNFASILLLLLTKDRDITRTDGMIFLSLYIIYLVVLAAMS